MEGRFKGEGTYVYLWLIQADVWQKPTQHCKAVVLQLKTNKKEKNNYISTKSKYNGIIDLKKSKLKGT